MELGLIGLGRMSGNMARRQSGGIPVSAWNRSYGVAAAQWVELAAGIVGAGLAQAVAEGARGEPAIGAPGHRAGQGPGAAPTVVATSLNRPTAS